MKLPFSLLTLFSANILVDAFPSLNLRQLEGVTPDNLKEAIRSVNELKKSKRFFIDVNKPVDITGDHAFKPPSGNDQRGPCPGLNALANHGYISRNGVTTFLEVVTAINQVMGMGTELSLILGIMGTIWTGNPLSLTPGFSIGGPVDGVENVLGDVLGLVGEPRGLAGAHNLIETDGSLTRNDLYVTGDAATMNMTLFLDLHDRADKNGVISMDLLAEQAVRRFHDSVATNPYFYYGIMSGFISRTSGMLFLGRLLSNHSVEHPEGVLTQHVFRKFFGVYETADGKLEYRRGHETIPDNWYRIRGEYGLIPLNLDIVSWILKHPVLGSIGGNTGTVNSFTGLDLGDITGGVLNLTTLLQGNNLLCFALEVFKTFLPNSLSPTLKTLGEILEWVTDILVVPLLQLSCPAWKDLTAGGEPLWDAIQDKFPGAHKSGSSL